MRLTTVLVASDLNPPYLSFWPLVRRAWMDIADLEPVLVLVARPEDTPRELLADDHVRLFHPVAGIHTALQAQCIRLLYPALLQTDGAVLISDIDMLPLSPSYFRRAIAWASDDSFVAYRDVLLSICEIPMCYNAALAHTWGEIFAISTLTDVHSRLVEWADRGPYAGIRGQAGWNTDQAILYRALVNWGTSTHQAWVLGDDWVGFNRLDRADLRLTCTLTATQRRAIVRGQFSDYHMVEGAVKLNEEILDLACSRR